MPGIFDKIKAAGLATVVIALGGWAVAGLTNWLKFKGIPADVVAAVAAFAGGLVVTIVGYLKTEHTGTATPK